MSTSTNKAGDIIDDLISLKVDRQKTAIKKIISAMTIGRDVSKLFPHVVKCIITPNLELKKLVYLYIINYARVKPLETLLAVNALKRDASDFNGNPLTRALAVRTMGCLGVEEIMQFLCDPLKDALNDKDPYVRKTGALCVAKIYDINPQLAEDQFGFLDKIKEMLEEETNAMVLANCISALIEISTTKGKDILEINWSKCRHLMSALHENNEWTQIYLLEGISRYSPTKQDEINEMIERIIPCVSHSNAGVVLSVIKILIKLLDLVENPETIRSVCKKITPSLVTLLSSEPEIQYVALKNINILIQKRPIIFEKDIKIFFSSFTEPLYNKLEKLEIIYKLVSMNNIDIVLNELKEYASDVDIKFVRRSVKLIGQCAIKLEKAAQRCVETLVELVKTQVSFVIQEAIIALKDIFRRYPNTFEGAMAIINENLRTLDDPEAKAALIWIIGEYSDRIEGAENQLIKFIDNLKEEPYVIQINILDSATKTFLKCQSEESYNILNQVFDFCTKECEDPDVRDRGYMYYRLMTIDPQLASKIIVNDKPRINEDVSGFDDNLLAILMDNLGTMATIYEKPPEAFVKKTKEKYFEDDNEGEYEESQFNLNEDDYNMPKEKEKKEKKVDIVNNIDNEEEIQPKPKINNNIDLLDLGDFNTDSNNNNIINNNNMNNNMNNNNNVGINDLLGDLNNIDLGGGGGISNNNQINNNMNIQRFTVIEENSPGVSNPNKGLEVDASVYNNNNNFFLSIVLKNKSAGMPINNFVIQFNNNPFGLSVNPNCLNNITLMPGQISENNIPLSVNNPTQMPEPGQSTLQTGLRCNLNEYYFLLPCV
jgi:vesicle coat complex subunit